MIVDIQGWRLEKGQYLMTDPIVFSNKRDQLGNVDWGTDGMTKWMKNHECNKICKLTPMKQDPELIKKLQSYLQRFNEGKIAEIMKDLDMISFGQPK